MAFNTITLTLNNNKKIIIISYKFYFRAKEAALAQRPNLETVTEEGEEEAPSKEKDSKGQTELHRLAAQEGRVISPYN